jgi:hypothetical protein
MWRKPQAASCGGWDGAEKRNERENRYGVPEFREMVYLPSAIELHPGSGDINFYT